MLEPILSPLQLDLMCGLSFFVVRGTTCVRAEGEKGWSDMTNG